MGPQGFRFGISQKLWLMGAQRFVFEGQREILALFLFLIGICFKNPQKMNSTNRIILPIRYTCAGYNELI